MTSVHENVRRSARTSERDAVAPSVPPTVLDANEHVGRAPAVVSSEPQERAETRHRILTAGVQVLREVGHGEFSVQKVARAAGVYQGNVTYYWPRRRDLIEALATFAIQEYHARVFSGYAQLDLSASGWSTCFVGQVVQEAVHEDKVRLLPELWSIGNACPNVAAALGALYADAVELAIATFGLDGDDPSVVPLRRELYLLGLAAEGLTAWFGYRRADDELLVSVQQEIVARFAPALEQLHAVASATVPGEAGPGRSSSVASVGGSTRRSGSSRSSRTP